MSRLATFTIAAFAAGLSAQEIERYDLRKPSGSTNGILIVVVGGRELSVSNKAVKAWPGWTRTKLLYTQMAPAGNGSDRDAQALRIYDSPSLTSRTLTVENGSITDVTHILLNLNEIGLVISMKDGKGVPWVVLANDKNGVYRREPYAVPGPITRQMVEIGHYDPEQLAGRTDISRIPPRRKSAVRLLPSNPNPVGTWVGSLPAADAARRNITLKLQPGGSAVLVIEYAGKGQITQRGVWSQIESGLNVNFDAPPGGHAPSPMTWELKPAELIPKSWDTNEYGSTGLPLKRAAADGQPRP